MEHNDDVAMEMVQKIVCTRDLENSCHQDGSTPLHVAARTGMVRTVRALVSRGIPINLVTNLQGTALEMIVNYDYEKDLEIQKTTDCAEVLLSHGASLDQASLHHYGSLIYTTTTQGMERLSTVILKHQISRNIFTNLNERLLRSAIEQGFVVLTTQLIKAGVDPSRTTSLDSWGIQPHPQADPNGYQRRKMIQVLQAYYSRDSLVQQTRIYIRNLLHQREGERGIRRKIQTLPLPKPLIDFLNFEQDFLHISEEYTKYIPPQYFDALFSW